MRRWNVQGKRNNDKLEISGIPLKKGENCKQLVLDIAKLMKVNVTINDIDIAHRLRRGNIVIVFTSRQVRDEMWLNKRNLKGTTIRNLGLEPQNDVYGKALKGFIFLQEALTFYYKQLFFLTREKCKEMNIPLKQVYTYKGTIKVYIHNQKTIEILCEDDIQKIT